MNNKILQLTAKFLSEALNRYEKSEFKTMVEKIRLQFGDLCATKLKEMIVLLMCQDKTDKAIAETIIDFTKKAL